MEFLKELAKTLWLNHRKKVIAFILGLLFAGIAAVTGIPLHEIKDAAKSAAEQPAGVVTVSPPSLIPASAVPVTTVIPAPPVVEKPAQKK